MTDGSDSIESGAKLWTDRELLSDLYHGEGLSQREIANRLDCGVGTVSNQMNALGIKTRSSDRFQNGTDKHPMWVPWATFYTNQSGYEVSQSRDGDSMKKVRIHQLVAIANGVDPFLLFCDGFHVHHKNNVSWDNRHSNLEVLDPSMHRILHYDEEDGPWRDKETLKKYYESLDYTVEEIGDELGCHRDTIYKWAKRYGLERPQTRLSCGHTGFTNLGSGNYSCGNEECDSEYGRSTIEKVFF